MAAQKISGLSLLLAVVTFLAVWGGVTLLLTDPHGPSLPPSTATPRGALASLLLFWLPVVTGASACVTGMMGLSLGGQNPDVARRALTSILLGLVPACLAVGWLGLVLSNGRGH